MDISDWYDQLYEEVENAICLIEESGGCITLYDMLGAIGEPRKWSDLNKEEQKVVLDIFDDYFTYYFACGNRKKPFRMYSFEGTPDSPGKVEVEVFVTTWRDIFLRRYHYANGSIDWSIGEAFLADKGDTDD